MKVIVDLTKPENLLAFMRKGIRSVLPDLLPRSLSLMNGKAGKRYSGLIVYKNRSEISASFDVHLKTESGTPTELTISIDFDNAQLNEAPIQSVEEFKRLVFAYPASIVKGDLVDGKRKE